MPRKVTMPIIESPRQISFKEVALPDPGPREVTIQVKACAICGSDVHVFKGMHPAAPLPAGAGHELSGVVAEMGKEVSRFKVGDRVCMNPMLFCGKCYYCRRSQFNHCVQVTFCYRVGQSGFAQYINRDEDWVYHLPDSLSFEEGAVIEPTATAVHAAQSSGIQLGTKIAVFGAGPIGLQTLQAAKAHGATWAAIVDVVDYRLVWQRSWGQMSQSMLARWIRCSACASSAMAWAWTSPMNAWAWSRRCASVWPPSRREGGPWPWGSSRIRK